jgi:L-ribulose-5-phosphate 3-epimerase
MSNEIACTTGGYPGMDLSRVFEGLSKAGFRYVELTALPESQARIAPEHMTPEDVQALRRLMATYELTPISLSGHCDLSTFEGVELFKARIDLASELGIRIINTVTTFSESPKAVEVERFFTNMWGIIPYARERGVRIALETHGGLTATTDECLRTLERLGSDWVGINYDTANVIFFQGVRPEEDIVQIAPYVIHVHLKDSLGQEGVDDYPPLGQGNIDFKRIISVLDAAGYTGPYSAEIEFMDVYVFEPQEEDLVMRHTFQFMSKLLAGR